MMAISPNQRIRILGLPLDNLTMDQALDRIMELIIRPGPARVFFLNAHCANIACRDPEYRRLLEEADLVLADGSGLALAGRMLKRPIIENVNGTDLFPLLMQRLASQNRKVYLLGAKPGIAAKVSGWLITAVRGWMWLAGTATAARGWMWPAGMTGILIPWPKRSFCRKSGARKPTSCWWPWGCPARKNGSTAIWSPAGPAAAWRWAACSTFTPARFRAPP